MIWPPLKAWTSIFVIEGQVHFVAINYGGNRFDRWVILMSVLDSSVVVKVSWSQLVDSANWRCGWDEKNSSSSYELPNGTCQILTAEDKDTYPSVDSGLTVPITKNNIRNWFLNA